jgi:cytochrome c biogenesis protein CcdA
MIGMIRHLVQEPHARTRATRALALYWLGASVTAGLLGATISSLGTLVRNLQQPAAWAIWLGACALAFAAADLGVLGLRTPSRHVQTCSTWWYELGRWKAWFTWGTHLGLGFLTIRATSLYWLVLALVLLFASPVEGAIVMNFYAGGLVLGWGAVAVLFQTREADGGARLLLRARGPIVRASGFLLLGLAILLPAFILGSV